MGFRHEYRITVEAVEALAGAEATAASGATREVQIVQGIGAILARAGGKACVVARDGVLEIGWTPSPEAARPLDVATAALTQGRYPEGILILRLLRSETPHDYAVLYNLGMALSDVDELPAAIETLEVAVAVAPRSVNARVALAVALARAGEAARAMPLLEGALQASPDNLWAHRNLGACLLQARRAAEALPHFQSVVAAAPADAAAHMGLAQAHEALGQAALAEAEYRRTIALDEDGPAAGPARKGLARLAAAELRGRLPEGLRTDAVMYLLEALTKLRGMAKKEIEGITLKIAVLGRSGFDVNDAALQYTLTSLPGEHSGLQLVCILYAGLRASAVDAVVGLDLAAEYEAALSQLNDQHSA